MTNEEAIAILKTADFPEDYTVEEIQQALDMAINALQENPKLIEEAEKWKAYFEEEIANEW